MSTLELLSHQDLMACVGHCILLLVGTLGAVSLR